MELELRGEEGGLCTRGAPTREVSPPLRRLSDAGPVHSETCVYLVGKTYRGNLLRFLDDQSRASTIVRNGSPFARGGHSSEGVNIVRRPMKKAEATRRSDVIRDLGEEGDGYYAIGCALDLFGGAVCRLVRRRLPSAEVRNLLINDDWERR